MPPNHLKHNKKELLLLGESWGGTFNKLSHLEKEMGRGFLNGLGGAPNKQLFFYRQRRTFFTAKDRFFYRRAGCRHAVHDGGDGGGGKEENCNHPK